MMTDESVAALVVWRREARARLAKIQHLGTTDQRCRARAAAPHAKGYFTQSAMSWKALEIVDTKWTWPLCGHISA